MSYDLICVGTGFASTFFLHKYLETAKPDARVLVLERGNIRDLQWTIQNQKYSDIDSEKLIHNTNPEKPWVFTVRYGGGSNCWFACTPRMMPSDFEMQSKYGVSYDWPISYSDLESYYCDAEEIMSISGTSDAAPYYRSRPYPQPPHRFNDLDLEFKKAYPDKFFIQATARARISTNRRPGCCATGSCNLCPINAKFTIHQDMAYLFEDERVELKTGANVQLLEYRDNIITGVVYEDENGSQKANAEFVALGANAIFNTHILKRSGIDDAVLGKYFGEQVSASVKILLDGVDNYQGSTSITGQGYMFYDGEHRKEYGASLLENFNTTESLRMEAGRTRQQGFLVFVIEDIPEEHNQIVFNPDNPDIPEIHFKGHSDYGINGIKAIEQHMQELSNKLPIESYEILPARNTDSHVMGGHRMGNDATQSVVDKYQVHHKYRNLCVLGSGSFPSFAPANPTLTLAAMSLYSGNYLFN